MEIHMHRAHAIRRHLKEDGFSDFVYLSTRNVLEWISLYLEHRYDRIHNIQTTGSINIDSLHDIDSENRDFGRDYVPTPVSILKNSITAIDESIEDFVFVDVGSGKGRMLFAASNYPFKKIIGIEFSSRLCHICQTNINSFINKRIKCRDIEVIKDDIVNYSFPNENLFIFMFNPFSEYPMKKLISNLRNHILRTRKILYIAYYNPKHGDILQNSDFLASKNFRRPLIYCSLRPVWPLAVFRSRLLRGTSPPSRSGEQLPASSQVESHNSPAD